MANPADQTKQLPCRTAHWYEVEETKKKKKLEIGGGLAAGAALLAGGLFAYMKHEEHREQAKADAWLHNNCLQEAKDHMDNYRRNGSHYGSYS